jgi:hypothetical protein
MGFLPDQIRARVAQLDANVSPKFAFDIAPDGKSFQIEADRREI